MQNEARKTPISPTFGRSSIERLPGKLRKAVDRAVADGATITEITALIRAEGGTCSRSAVGRYAKSVRDLIRRQQETDRAIEAWVRGLGERPEGQAGLILIETLRALALAAMADLSGREEPVPMQELARLALILKRIEGTDRLRLDREQAARKAARAGGARGQGSLSPKAVAIRAEVEGGPPPRTVTSVPVDPWPPPQESRSSHPVPADPGESWPEIAPRVFRTSPTSILSLGPGRDAGGIGAGKSVQAPGSR